MMMGEIESDWRETLIPCPKCGGMTYSNGIDRPQCEQCLRRLTDQEIYTWLIEEFYAPDTVTSND